MNLSEVHRILQDKRSSELEIKIAENELRRYGFFSNLNLNSLLDKLFLEIKANPNVLMKQKGSRDYEPLTHDFFYNLIYVCRFRFFKSGEIYDQKEIPKDSLGLTLYFYDLSGPRLDEFSFLFLDKYFECLERISKSVPDYVREFAKEREFESGLVVYKRLENILRAQILTE